MTASETIDLTGEGWTLREALGDTAEWYLGAPLPEAGNNVADASAAIAAAPGWLSARVPGAVIDDLHRAGELPDPRVGRNSRFAEWTAERSWVYRRAVDLPEPRPDTVAVLELDGVDPGADVHWDGERIGSVDGLYHRLRLTLTDAQRAAGRHKLALRVHPAPDSEPQVGRTERVRVHTPRLGYGWDFSPRMRHQGVWRPVRLRIGRALLGDVVVSSRVEDAVPGGGASGGADGRVGGTEGLVGTVDVRWDAPLAPRSDGALRHAPRSDGALRHAPRSDGAPRVTVEVALGSGGDGAAARTTVPADAGSARVHIPVPELWWPNTVGAQPLYTVTVTLHDDAGAADRTERVVGFRTASLERNAGGPEGAIGYTAVINGRRVPLLGWNWTPADAQFGSIDDARLEHLLGMAAASGARLVRVWGGGLIESEHFYATCDRLGLLVWQEFSQSSSGMQSAPSTDPAFVALMRAEAEAIVPTRIHHPSLLLWGGGNELDEGGVPLSDDRSPVLAALHDTVAEHDPGRPWLPTSPTGPEFAHRLDRIQANPDGQHDVHGPWEHQGLVAHYTLANAGTNLAHTEFGVEGMTNLRSLEALIPEADRWPAGRTNAVYRHLGEWWNNATQVVELFGGRPAELVSLNRASQLLQATGLQYSVEADRRRWPRCSMVLPWQLNESYPNAWCTAAVDFRGDPKPAYFAVGRAFGRRRATFRVTRAVWAGEETASAEAWLWAEDGVAAGSTLELRAVGVDGAELGRAGFDVAAVEAVPAAAGRIRLATAGLPPVFLWQAEWRAADGSLLDQERMIATSTPDFGALFDVPATTVAAERTADGAVRVRNDGEVAALTVRLVDARHAVSGATGDPGWGAAVVGGDPRPLLPGEGRVLAADARVPILVESWNALPVELGA